MESLAPYVKKWTEPPSIPDLTLPGPNPFVPEDLSVIIEKKRTVRPGDGVPPPKVVQLRGEDVWTASDGRTAYYRRSMYDL